MCFKNEDTEEPLNGLRYRGTPKIGSEASQIIKLSWSRLAAFLVFVQSRQQHFWILRHIFRRVRLWGRLKKTINWGLLLMVMLTLYISFVNRVRWVIFLYYTVFIEAYYCHRLPSKGYFLKYPSENTDTKQLFPREEKHLERGLNPGLQETGLTTTQQLFWTSIRNGGMLAKVWARVQLVFYETRLRWWFTV